MFRYVYRAKILYVHDARRYDVLVDLGFNITKKVAVVLDGVEVPSTHAQDGNERDKAWRAKKCAIRSLLHKWCRLETFKAHAYGGSTCYPCKVCLIENSQFEDSLVDEGGEKLVDFSKYLRALSVHDFDPEKVDLIQVEDERYQARA